MGENPDVWKGNFSTQASLLAFLVPDNQLSLLAESKTSEACSLQFLLH